MAREVINMGIGIATIGKDGRILLQPTGFAIHLDGTDGIAQVAANAAFRRG